MVGAAIAAAGCGGDDPAKPSLTVFAAASLTEALQACAPAVDDARPRASFAGSNALAAQIRQGTRPDVFVAASTTLPDRLHEEGLLDEPVVVAVNALVLAVPEDSGIDGIDDLGGDGVQLAIGAEGVPAGDYTREVLDRLPAARAQAILATVRSEEPDVKGVVGKLTQGAVDAGFVYATDVTAASGRLRAIRLPAALRPDVAYAAGVVTGTRHPEAAARYVEGLIAGPCADTLAAAGFHRPRTG